MKILFCLFLIFNFSLNAIEKLVIIGTGPAGCSAAIFAGQAQLSPYVVEGEPCRGQIAHVSIIENYPGFPEGINGEELIERMRLQAQQFGARFDDHYVTEVDFRTFPFKMKLDNGEIIESASVIIATGSAPRWLNVPHEEALKGRGISISALCDSHLFAHKSVIVAGGGDAALEQALALTDYADKITILHRGNRLNASSYLISKVNTHPKIHIILNAKIQNILGEDSGWVKGIVYQNLTTKHHITLPCAGLIVAIGRKPDTDLFVGQLEMDEAGYIITQPNSSMASISGIFVAGDITPNAPRKVVTAAASGCTAALEARQYLNE